MELKAKPCPFCGHEVDFTEGDTLYPSGAVWYEIDGERYYRTYKERRETDNPCYVLNCVLVAGGCGVSMHGDSIEEALERWNRRAYDS